MDETVQWPVTLLWQFRGGPWRVRLKINEETLKWHRMTSSVTAGNRIYGHVLVFCQWTIVITAPTCFILQSRRDIPTDGQTDNAVAISSFEYFVGVVWCEFHRRPPRGRGRGVPCPQYITRRNTHVEIPKYEQEWRFLDLIVHKKVWRPGPAWGAYSATPNPCRIWRRGRVGR